MLATIIFGFTVVITIITYLWLNTNKKLRHIPGPRGYPLLGNVLQLRTQKNPILKMTEWSKEFGPVYAMRIFGQNRIVVSGFDELNEILVTKGRAFGGRPYLYRQNVLQEGTGVLFTSPTKPQWFPLRKTAYRALHHYADGMNRIETVLATMAEEFVKSVKAHQGTEIDLRDHIYGFVVKVTATMLCGNNATDEDEVVKLLKEQDIVLLNAANPSTRMELDRFPWLRYLGHPVYKILQQGVKLTNAIWAKARAECADSYASSGEASCAVNCILQLQDKNSSHYDPNLNDTDIKILFRDLAVASVSTTTATLCALPNILVHYPNVQQALRHEVDRVVGASRLPSIRDRDAMPYACATIFELLRYTNVVPTLMHETLEDTSVGGYSVPAGTRVVPLFWALHHDEAFWGDPWVFRPERYLDDGGRLMTPDHPHRKHLMAFGSGFRVCIGEAFAMKRLFIFATSLVQAFEIEAGSELVSCDPRLYTVGTILRPLPHSVKFVNRY